MRTLGWLGLVGGAFAGLSLAQAASLEDWAQEETRFAERQMLAAISPLDGAPGAVMASPSRQEPDYYFHWIRDSALTMREVLELYKKSHDSKYERILFDYASFSRRNQQTPNPSGAADRLGVGEPKFMMDGSAFNGSWGRPQNDGPALRARVLIDFARELRLQGRDDEVSRYLYRAEFPAQSVIKVDLEYVAQAWSQPSFDLWEEVEGDHFYTRIAQWRALREGAEFARSLGDESAAQYYGAAAARVQPTLDAFWSPASGWVFATRTRVGGAFHKTTQLDVAVILGVLHSAVDGESFGVDDDRVISTANALETKFLQIYAVNQIDRDREGYAMAPAIGRYPEDTYDGTRIDRLGNPWFLATHAMAEYDRRLAKAIASRAKKIGDSRIDLTPANRAFFRRLMPTPLRRDEQDLDAAAVVDALVARSDAYLRRSKYHTANDGHQSEQLNRDNGFMQGARDLTWSYASFLSLMRTR